MRVGRVAELWRHPVKSLGGERIERADVHATAGVPGDRSWALRDERENELRSAKKLPALLGLSARCLAEPSGDEVPPVEIRLRDGTLVRGDDPRASELVSRDVGRALRLFARRPASDLDHYRRARPVTDFAAEIRAASGLLPDEPVPALPDVVGDLALYATPPGTYFDAFPLHLLTTASLAELARRAPDSRIDVRRFRPNVVIDTSPVAEGFVEADWSGRELRVGEARAHVVMPMMRCAMTTCAQGDLPKDPRIMRALVREAGMNLGVGAVVTRPGRVAVGDPVELI
jgi:uncharacterized protein YcbX